MKRILLKESLSSISYKLLDKNKTYFLKEINESFLKDIARKDKKVVKRRLLSLNHENLVKIFYILYERDKVFITTEYINGISLHNYFNLKKYGKIISPDLKQFIAKGVIRGIIALHENKLIHGDLKPSNIIINSSNYVPKLTDYFFNYVKIYERYNFVKKLFNRHYKYYLFSSKLFLPPKSFLNINIKKGVDYYALGLVLFKLYLEKDIIPFTNIRSLDDVIKWKLSSDHDQYFIKNLEKSNLSHKLINFILHLILNYDDNIQLSKYLELF